MKKKFAVIGLLSAMAFNAVADDPSRSAMSGMDVETIAYERQLQADAAERRRLEMRQEAARAVAHADMPSTMYASTPSDPDKVPHAVPSVASQSDAIVELVMPRYLESVAKAATRPISQRWQRILRTIQTVEQNRGRRDSSQDRTRMQNPIGAPATSLDRVPPRPNDRLVIPYFPSTSDPSGRQGLLRLVNHSSRVSEVSIRATFDDGMIAEPIAFSIDPASAFHLTSEELEHGNAAKGLTKGTGAGLGAWSLRVSSDATLDALAYIQTADGFLASIHDVAPQVADDTTLAFISTTSDANSPSWLRLVNSNATPATVAISGYDEHGNPSDSVTVELPGHQARTYAAHELATGAAPGLAGYLGESRGDWRLTVRSDPGVLVMSFAANAAGHFANLSNLPANNGNRSVPLFLSASDPHGRQGLVHIANRENRPGEVRIQATDDAGDAYETLILSIGSNGVAHVDSNDLELGNRTSGITGNTGPGVGNWRLDLSSELELEVQSFARTPDGLMMPMQDVVSRLDNRHDVSMFKAVDKTGQVGLLRLINAGSGPANVMIQGTDDHGTRQGSVRLMLASNESRTLAATELESGGEDLNGELGDGSGEWRLAIASDVPIDVMNLLATPTGHLINLSTAAALLSVEKETAESVFETHISAIVQSQCINCHIAGGAAQTTRLIFVGDEDPDPLTKNMATFQALLDDEDDGAEYVLSKIQGVSHGGGAQVNAGTDEFAAMKRFLELLGEDVEEGSSVTVATLFDGVALETHRQTLRRAAIVFAGRTPTDEEYAILVDGDDASLRRATRGLMEGAGFHNFLVRASNDRLLTDREFGRSILPRAGFFVDYTNKIYEFINAKGGSEEGYGDALEWRKDVNYGVARAPLELIAYVVQNDLPYTEILTADYIMANPMATEAYGGSVDFKNMDDVHEFMPTEILSYYRTDESKQKRIAFDKFTIVHVVDPGNLHTDFPHAGVLNTNAFLLRYPTTATNRNRARSRWTYYHFLGLDIEKSASRTTDPVALADTNNPTLINPACTVCHIQLDPVAGAYQNYGDEGLYRDQWGGMDSLDGDYKDMQNSRPGVPLTGRNWHERETVVWDEVLGMGSHSFVIWAEAGFGSISLDRITLYDSSGHSVWSREFETLPIPQEKNGNLCGQAEHNIATGNTDYFKLAGDRLSCSFVLDVEVAVAGSFRIELIAWSHSDDDRWRRENGVEHGQVKFVINGYREGDTWYRDMRTPGFGDEVAPDNERSVQWLAERIVEDKRFTEATVRFWWPALMGSEVTASPEDIDDAEYDATLLAANAQAHEVTRLATGFEAGFGEGAPYNLKDLFVELALSKWFRADSFEIDDPVRNPALRNAGARRLLTPDELAQKTLHLTGFQWGRQRGQTWRRPHEQKFNSLTDPTEYGLLYGGIDSDGVTERPHDLSSVMAGVAQSHAIESSCPIVMRELFLLQDEDRRLFKGFDRNTTPTQEFGEVFEIEGASRAEIETFTVEGNLRKGEVLVKLAYLNDYWSPEADRDVLLDRLRVLRGADVVFNLEMEDHEHEQDCHHTEQDAFHLSGSGSECILTVSVDIPADDIYKVEVDAWGDQAGDEAPRLAVTVESDVERSVGSMAIRTQLVDLYEKLHGLHATVDSEEVRNAYELYVEAWQENLTIGRLTKYWKGNCAWSDDRYFLDGILDDAWDRSEKWWDWERVSSYFNTVDLSDPQGAARAWVVVMAYLLMDYRYLYL